MNDCLFCKIITGEIPSYTIYEDEIVKIFLDINPSTNGDALIIPKKHFKDLEDTLKKAIMKAEETSDNIKRMARDESEMIVSDAKHNANRIVNPNNPVNNAMNRNIFKKF